jgi:hypothetical protein
MKLLRKVMMFKLRKKKFKSLTVRAKDLQVGDRLLYDDTYVTVTAIKPEGEKTIVVLEMTYLGDLRPPQPIKLSPEWLISIARQ